MPLMLARYKHFFHIRQIITFSLLVGILNGCAEEVELAALKANCYDEKPFSISNVNVSESLIGNGYATGYMADNQKVFVDRSFIYQSLASKFLGLPYILTANADKSSDPLNNNFITFTVNRPTQLFVALDSRVTPPTWLQSWQRSSDTISDTDITRTLYLKNLDNCQISLGGNGGSPDNSMYTIIVAEQTNVIPPDDIIPDPSQPKAPIAINDIASTLQFSPITINVLNNDLNISATIPISLTLADTNSSQSGTLSVESDNRITYTPPSSNFIGNDTFRYTIQNTNGEPSTSSSADVVVSVICTLCVDQTVNLSWNSNPVADVVSGYKIYTSDTAISAQTLFMDVASNRAGFNPNQPSISLSTKSELNLLAGQQICFHISAYNAIGESALTSPACT